jgi:hypothetical protein
VVVTLCDPLGTWQWCKQGLQAPASPLSADEHLHASLMSRHLTACAWHVGERDC